MLWLISMIGLMALVLGPSFWVRYTLSRYGQLREDLPGTGSELAQHLLTRFDVHDVQVERTDEYGDHYDPNAQRVRLSPSVFDGRSLTAVAVAAHEVGHAIQYARQDKVTYFRRRFLPLAVWLQNMGAGVLVGWPLISLILHIPYLVPLHLLIVFMTGMLAVLMHLAVLPEEWDASFYKALPILLDGGYINAADTMKVRRILMACAFTYVASALVRVFFFWRWFKR